MSALLLVAVLAVPPSTHATARRSWASGFRSSVAVVAGTVEALRGGERALLTFDDKGDRGPGTAGFAFVLTYADDGGRWLTQTLVFDGPADASPMILTDGQRGPWGDERAALLGVAREQLVALVVSYGLTAFQHGAERGR